MFSFLVHLSALLAVFTFSSRGVEGSGIDLHSAYNVPYQGPPAPLNHDGTVALTPEVKLAKAAHHAAGAEEFRRLHEVDALAAAHPDLTSPPHSNNDKQYSAAFHSQGPSYTYNTGARIPAPLNHDGTVAQTADYKAIAAAHIAEYQKVSNSKAQDSIYQPDHFKHLNSKWTL